MKTLKNFTTALLILLSISVTAQQGINYKALIKDGSGNVVANQGIIVQFQILKGVGMSLEYQETHSPNTDANGIVMVNIGEGSVNSGVFADIDWGSDDHFLNVQIDTGGGLTDMGTTQFMAVPYALSAKTVNLDNLYTAGPGITIEGNVISLSIDNTISYTLNSTDISLIGDHFITIYPGPAANVLEFGSFVRISSSSNYWSDDMLLEAFNVLLDASDPSAQEEQKYILTYVIYDGSTNEESMSVIKTGGVWVYQE